MLPAGFESAASHTLTVQSSGCPISTIPVVVLYPGTGLVHVGGGSSWSCGTNVIDRPVLTLAMWFDTGASYHNVSVWTVFHNAGSVGVQLIGAAQELKLPDARCGSGHVASAVG